MCFVLPRSTGFFVIDIVDLLLQKINVGLDGKKFSSSIILVIQIACFVAHDVDENDTIVISCFFEVQDTTVDPKLSTYLLALFLSSHDPAQSLGEYPAKLKF